ncbi:MAG: hypothetical protein ACREAY_01930 [Nitrososphaera sp.]|uniref:hypothetical protein n=1 Tax=Nitrososphaera sp. TaxID=1971748 RepID=UPI003D6DAB80
MSATNYGSDPKNDLNENVKRENSQRATFESGTGAPQTAEHIRDSANNIRDSAIKLRETIRALRESGAIKEIGAAVREAAAAARDTAREIDETAKDLEREGVIKDTASSLGGAAQSAENMRSAAKEGISKTGSTQHSETY